MKRKAFEVASPDLTVDFLLNGLDGLLVKYLPEGRSAKRFTDDAMTMARPIMGKRIERAHLTRGVSLVPQTMASWTNCIAPGIGDHPDIPRRCRQGTETRGTSTVFVEHLPAPLRFPCPPEHVDDDEPSDFYVIAIRDLPGIFKWSGTNNNGAQGEALAEVVIWGPSIGSLWLFAGVARIQAPGWGTCPDHLGPPRSEVPIPLVEGREAPNTRKDQP